MTIAEEIMSNYIPPTVSPEQFYALTKLLDNHLTAIRTILSEKLAAQNKLLLEIKKELENKS